ncbi:MAG: hypothetical protein AAFY84_14755 [Pseudomonadota bacterium]
MAMQIKDVILNFAARFSDHAAGQSAVHYAQERGWLDGEGEPTSEGKAAAKAFDDQSQTRSALRIG